MQTIQRCYLVGGRSAHHINAIYTYEVDGKIYEDDMPIACDKLNEKLLSEELSGKRIQVLYNPRWPSNNYLLKDKINYERFGLVMPDSLLWIDSLLLCR